METLLLLTCYKDPPKLPVWSQLPQATYIVGDASETNFGLCCWTHETEQVRVEFGRWTQKVELDKSSNFREAGDLIVRVMRMVATGQISKGSELFVFTDNRVIESTYL